MNQKAKRNKRPRVRLILLCLTGTIALAALIFMRFGGFGTGESASPEEFAAYAGKVEDIAIPERAQIIALGEATHGNVEFQRLKLDVFKLLVERYSVRAFALEGDYGGCEQVNRYIHGGKGTSREAINAIGFAIYRTQEMEELVTYMREYNDNAAEGEDLRFYGYDMQRYAFSLSFLKEACGELGVDTSDLEKLIANEDWSGSDYPERIEVITRVRTELVGKDNSQKAVHYADMLLQYCELLGAPSSDGGLLRDRFMAENIRWVSEQERGARIFVAGHNSHVAKWGSYNSMGRLLADELGESYYVIGTDFYKTTCNMPGGSFGKRTNQVFYSHDPLAKAAKMAGLDICWLDFAKASDSPELASIISDYTFMGNLGERYSFLMRLLPPSYRMFQPPAELYDGMIFVSEATPTTIYSEQVIG